MTGLEGIPNWLQWFAGFVGFTLILRGLVWTWSRTREGLARLFRRAWIFCSPHRWDLVAYAESIVVAVDQGVARIDLGGDAQVELWLRLANLGPGDVRFTATALSFHAGGRRHESSCSNVKEIPSQFGIPRAGTPHGLGAQMLLRLPLRPCTVRAIRESVAPAPPNYAAHLDTTVEIRGHLQVGSVGREVRLLVWTAFAVWGAVPSKEAAQRDGEPAEAAVSA